MRQISKEHPSVLYSDWAQMSMCQMILFAWASFDSLKRWFVFFDLVLFNDSQAVCKSLKFVCEQNDKVKMLKSLLTQRDIKKWIWKNRFKQKETGTHEFTWNALKFHQITFIQVFGTSFQKFQFWYSQILFWFMLWFVIRKPLLSVYIYFAAEL